MKRRTFLQTVVGLIAAVFIPKPKQDPMAEFRRATANTKFKPPLKKGEQNPDGQLCLIYDAEQRPNTRLVRYVGQKKIFAGSLVYYVDELRRDVTTGPQICFLDETKTEFEFAGVVKIPPGDPQMEHPFFLGNWIDYKENLDA